MKKCAKCKQEKPLSEFPKNKAMSDGLSYSCKACEMKRNKAYKATLPPEYNIWSSMRGRCLVKKHTSYPRYGAKGIKVCERWDSFQNFYADMGSRPTPKHQIDRIDGKGNYCPENCRWATPTENARNKSTTKLNMPLAYKIRAIYSLGEDSQYELADEFGLSQATIWNVLHNKCWVKEAV